MNNTEQHLLIFMSEILMNIIEGKIREAEPGLSKTYWEKQSDKLTALLRQGITDSNLSDAG